MTIKKTKGNKKSAKAAPIEKAALTSPPVIVKGSKDFESAFKQREFKICVHSGNVAVMQIRGITIYGAKLDQISDSDSRLLLNCSGSDLAKNLITVPDNYSNLLTQTYARRVINMNWRDQGIPAVKPEFWIALIDAMIANNDHDLVIFCIGSHGRTGTAMASLIIANLGLSASDAVNFVRNRHCAQCIESDAQIRYLQRLAKHFNCSSDADKNLTGSYSARFDSKYNDLDRYAEISKYYTQGDQ
jgi:hypothetical protein